MKILIKTPITDAEVYNDAAIYNDLLKDVEVFSVNMFLDYLLETKKAKNIEHAVFLAINGVNRYCLDRELLREDYVLIGNCSRENKFDVIIEYNSKKEFKTNPDFLINKMREKYKDEKELAKLLTDLIPSEAAESVLVGVKETCDFIRKILKNE